MRENEDSLQRVGYMLASRIRQFAPSTMEAVTTSGVVADIELSEQDRMAEVDLKVDVISNLDDLKAAEFQKLLLFKNLGLAGDERLIKDSGLSSTETLLAELPDLRAAQAAAALQGGLVPGGPPPAGPVQTAAEEVVAPRKAVDRSLRTAIGGEQ
jgi:hypothetical protein